MNVQDRQRTLRWLIGSTLAAVGLAAITGIVGPASVGASDQLRPARTGRERITGAASTRLQLIIKELNLGMSDGLLSKG